MRKDLTRETTCEEYVINKMYELEELLNNLAEKNRSMLTERERHKNCIKEIVDVYLANPDVNNDKYAKKVVEILERYGWKYEQKTI